MLQRNMMEGNMTTLHGNAASGWLDNSHKADWLANFGNGLRSFFGALNNGLEAAHEYRNRAAHVRPQQASREVFLKYFSE
jgi:hypothetical protein